MYNEADERKAFEDAAYSEYMANENAARLANPRAGFAPSMPKELFLKLDDNGKFMLIGLDSAWWAWKSRAKLVWDAILRERSLPGYVGPGKATCGTCKYLGKSIPGWQGQPSGFFPCTLIEHQKDMSDDGCDGEIPKGAGAVVVDGSGYHAALCVESDFACNRYETKE